MKKYEVKIVLVILGIDLRTNESYVVSLNNNTLILPYQFLNNQIKIQQMIFEIEKTHINLDTNWIHNDLVSCIENTDDISLLYKCMIPLDTDLINAYWLPVWQHFNNPIIPEVINK